MPINTADRWLSCVSTEKDLQYWVLLRRCLWTDGNINNLETGLLKKPLKIYHHSHKSKTYIILFKVILLKHGNWNDINSKVPSQIFKYDTECTDSTICTVSRFLQQNNTNVVIYSQSHPVFTWNKKFLWTLYRNRVDYKVEAITH